MTDEPIAASGDLINPRLQVRYKTLLGILLIVPLFTVIAVTDYFLLGKTILNFSNEVPRNYILFAMALIALPHIVASLITFADKEYLSYYRRPLFRGVIIAGALGIGAPFLFGIVATWVIMAFYTMYHTLAQQFGISLMMLGRTANRDFTIYKWLLLLPSSFAYLLLLEADSSLPQSIEQMGFILLIACPIAAAFFGIRFYLDALKTADNKIGLFYFIGTAATLYISLILLLSGYILLAILIPRLIHDFTAFWIYMVHDQNRNAGNIRNPIYYLPRKVGIPPVLFCAPIAISLSLILLYWRQDFYVLTMFVSILIFMHYYIEGIMWKRGTPHRQHVPFV
jgi:hypothetical protein